MSAQGTRTGAELIALHYSPCVSYWRRFYWASPNRQWFVRESIPSAGPDPLLTYTLSSLAHVRQMWPHEFVVLLEDMLKREWAEGRANQPMPRPVRKE